MREKQTKAATMQWLLLTAILLIAIVIMFIDFYMSSSKSARTQVERSFTDVTEEHASTLKERLTGIQKTGKTITAVMENHSGEELELAEEAVEALYAQTDAYMVIMTNLGGQGVDQNREEISIAKMD